MNAKQEYETNKANITIKYKVKGCTCEYQWRSIRPGHHNGMIGELAGYTQDNKLILRLAPNTSWCETTTWEIQDQIKSIQSVTTSPIPDRYNYDGPGSKLHS